MKRKYRAPRIICTTIDFEEGIAVSSATITPFGGTDNNFQPQVDDYVHDKNEENGFFN